MPYNFTVTEPQLERISLYMQSLYHADYRQYIVTKHCRLADDLIVVVIDCSPESATFIHLIT